MKYPCDLIKDLLPLYHDGVCSADSAATVEAHLKECASCQAYYQAMCSTEATLAPPGKQSGGGTESRLFSGCTPQAFQKADHFSTGLFSDRYGHRSGFYSLSSSYAADHCL